MKKLIVCAVLAMAFAMTTARAGSPFTIAGTAIFNKTNYTKGSNYIATTMTMAFNNKLIYLLISNAVANASNGSNGIAATLPADGYIGYFPEYFDGKYNGYFYVADKKGFYYPLSGFDDNLKHYSFMELKTFDQWLGQLGPTNNASTNDDCCCCCCDYGSLPRLAFSETYNQLTGKGTYKAEDMAVIDIRSIPYFNQHVEQNAISLVGTFSPSFTLRDSILWSPSSATFSGIGGVVVQQGPTDFNYGVINSLSVKFSF